MKVVDARLSTGETVTIAEEWFVAVVDRGASWERADVVEAHFGSGMVAMVNPKFIVWARILERGV
jgi:hypothetical protein